MDEFFRKLPAKILLFLNNNFEKSRVLFEEAEIIFDDALYDLQDIFLLAQVMAGVFHKFTYGVLFEGIEEAFLGVEVAIDGPFGNAGSFSDGVDCRGVVPLVREFIECGLEYSGPRISLFLALWPFTIRWTAQGLEKQIFQDILSWNSRVVGNIQHTAVEFPYQWVRIDGGGC